jgi:hypothetical protein
MYLISFLNLISTPLDVVTSIAIDKYLLCHPIISLVDNLHTIETLPAVFMRK